MFSAISVGPNTNKILCFGGGANNSNAIVSIDITSAVCNNNEVNSGTTLHCTSSLVPTYSRAAPYVRISSTAVRVGRYMIIYGGWNNVRRELDDIWVST